MIGVLRRAYTHVHQSYIRENFLDSQMEWKRGVARQQGSEKEGDEKRMKRYLFNI